jgi:hypothetical protein
MGSWLFFSRMLWGNKSRSNWKRHAGRELLREHQCFRVGRAIRDVIKRSVAAHSIQAEIGTTKLLVEGIIVRGIWSKITVLNRIPHGQNP